MNIPAPDNEEAKLRALLREAHSAPSLPPRFQERVWARLERAEKDKKAGSSIGWLDRLVRNLVRPAYAVAGLAVVMFAGLSLGIRDGENRVHQDQKARYVAAVSPFNRSAP